VHPTTGIKSVQAPNATSFSLNDLFKEVAKTFQQIMMAQWGQFRRKQNNILHKYCIKSHEAKWPQKFVDSKYNCTGKGCQQL
jgi:hypothetical protein